VDLFLSKEALENFAKFDAFAIL